ncbi:hypothetical protein [Altericroceibacterium endophyticum]|uniref:Uncharacterized protein n=1 Tax=Altericroceibacterium endophyticum TaxID=1808508 RepID=A0A6I4T344_9SPHN|nr:hypothetical protein [Altericroceibacterium endophyticum]MXO64649.1 hypothetical protein [Altericroceibacterium endophyticum]
MTEERITKVETPDGETHTETTIITERDQPRSRMSVWFVMFVVVVAVIVALWAFNKMGTAEVAKDNAIAGAADDVGAAAGQIGNAAEDVANSVTQD